MYNVIYGIIVILDHQNIGVHMTFLVVSCLVLQIRCKIHNLVMVESRMATKAATWHFCDGSIVENVHGPKLYNCTKLNAIEKVNVFSAYHPNI